MKNFKRILGLMLTFIMVMSLGFSAFANDGDVDNGKITINNAAINETYTIWQILDLESYNTESNAYSYKATAAWKDFVESTGIAGTYLNTDEKGYVTWNKSNESAEDIATFAKLAKEYAETNNVANQGLKVADSTVVVFENLDLGYYLIDTTLGTLCTLNTTDYEVEIEDKNAKPVLVKQVQEDSNNNWQDMNDADIGQTINFMSNIIAQEGAYNYVLHDKMSSGLLFTGVTSVTYRPQNSQTETEIDKDNYKVITEGLTDGCTFHVEFNDDYLETLKDIDEILVYYSAKLTSDAIIGGDPANFAGGNENEAWVSYGNNSSTTHDITRTYTWELNIFKYTEKTNGKTPLSGAQFVIKTVFHEGQPTQYAIVENGKIVGWTMNMKYPEGVNKADILLDKNNNHILDTQEEGDIDNNPIYATILTTSEEGLIEIIGLDGFTTYMIEEVKAPAGYNILANDVVVTINQNGTLTVSTDATTTGNIVNIENRAGAELPTTGGIGTTIFYIVGTVLVLGAVVLLVAKKRMNSAE